MVFYQSRGMACEGDFSQYRLNVKILVQVHFITASQFYVHINVELYITLSYILRSHKSGIKYTRFHTFMLSPSMIFTGENNGWVKKKF